MSDTKKNFILDTNVLLHDPKAIHRFGDNTLVIPIYVIEEIDTFKKDLSLLGRNARQISRSLDTYRQRGNLGVGVRMDNGGILKVALTTKTVPRDVLSKHQADNMIMAVALEVQEREPQRPCIFVTKDTNLRIRADALGLTAVNYEADVVSIDELYPGATELKIPGYLIDTFYQTANLELEEVLDQIEEPIDEDISPIEEKEGDSATDQTLYANEFVLLRDVNADNHTALGRIDANKERIVGLRSVRDGIWGIRPRNKEQHFALDCLLDETIELVTLLGKAGTGKAQPLDAKIMTPEGIKRMGQMEVGSTVLTPDGQEATVIGVFPQGDKEIYRVHFTDGSYTTCCREHLWYTWTTLNRDQQREGSVKSLEEIMGSLRYGAQKKRNHSIPITQPVPWPERTLPVDPYLLGVLIGDGSMSVGHLSISTADPFIIEECTPLLREVDCYFGQRTGYDYSVNCESPAGKPGMSFVRRDVRTGKEKRYASIQEVTDDGFLFTSVYRVCKGTYAQYRGFEWESIESELHSIHPIKNALIELHLWGHRSETKFVPELYKTASIDQRLALLQGLMDTDGTIDKRGHMSFSTTSEKLSQDLAFIVQSLGGTVTIRQRQTSYTHEGEKRLGRVSYRCNLCLPNEVVPFRLPRKVERVRERTRYVPRRYIDCVEYVGVQPAQCILIDHPEHLYLTDDFIVTHNTLLALAAGLAKTADEQLYQKLLVSRPIFPLGRDIGYLPGDIEDKLNPWMQPIFDNVEYLMGLSKDDKRSGRSYHELIDMGILQIEPLTYIRGRSIPNQYMIVDEAQNLTPHEVKTIITRAGEGTKLIFTGDPYQIDNPYVDSESNGLTYIITKFKGQSLAATVTLKKGERSRLAELAANLL